MLVLSFVSFTLRNTHSNMFSSSFGINVVSNSNANFIAHLFSDLLSLTIIIVNLSMLYGGIIYLLDFNGRNGRVMVIRSVVVFLLLFSLFSPSYDSVSFNFKHLADIFPLISIFISYFLFIFAALALILFIGNLGFYLLSSHPRRSDGLKRSGFCLLCILLPLGFQFPRFPL